VYSIRFKYIISLLYGMKLIQKAVIKRDDKYLILLRSPKSKYFPLHWDFPGGKLEPNETPIQGIEREVNEETNLKTEAQKIIKEYDLNIKSYQESISHRFTLFETKIIEGDVKISDEHLEYRWATKNEIKGIIDFGDAIETWVINDLVVPFTQVCFEMQDPYMLIKEIINAYSEEMDIPEFDSIYTLMKIRFATCILQPLRVINELGEHEDLRYYVDFGYRGLRELVKIGKKGFYDLIL